MATFRPPSSPRRLIPSSLLAAAFIFSHP
ncbi:MAG: hypothetical protein JWL81_3145, partial [Verrucomicrobiales bacterium]|nr:hypothetical protein [Verrucomicrobiales bacterium]